MWASALDTSVVACARALSAERPAMTMSRFRLARQSLGDACAERSVAADDEDAAHGAEPATLGVRLATALGGGGGHRCRNRFGGRRMLPAASGNAVGQRQQDAGATNTTWMTTSQKRSRSDTVVIDMNCFRSWIAEMATIEPSSLIFRAVKSMVPIHSGQSRCRL